MNKNKGSKAFAKCEQMLVILQIMDDLIQSGDDARDELNAATTLLTGLTMEVSGLVSE